MFPRSCPNQHKINEISNFESDFSLCMKQKASYELSSRSLCAMFSGSVPLKEANALAAQEKHSEAASALGEHFMYRIQPNSITHHSGLQDLRKKLQGLGKNYISSVLAQANQIVEQCISVKGRPPFRFQHCIDWFSDLAGHSWPKLHLAEIEQRLDEGIPLSTDPMEAIENTWELNKHSHFLTLGRAYWITGTETYAAEFIVQAVKWCHENPPLLGVNWYDPDTVATRTVNWLLALGMFIESPQLQPSHMALFIEALLAHGALLAYWFRQKKNITLSTVIALNMLADWMPEVKYAEAWHELAEDCWDEAIASEFNDDNFHKSASPAKQIISCEWLLLLALQREAALHRSERSPRLPQKAEDLLNDVLESLQCLLTPAGIFYDLGGYHHLEGFMGYQCSTAKHICNLLAIGAIVTRRAELYRDLPEKPLEILWWKGENGWSDLQELSQQYEPNTAYLFSKTGLGISNSGWDAKATHFTFKATPTSIIEPSESGDGTAAKYLFHNDALSLTLTINGEPFIIEPGLAKDPHKHDFRLSRLDAHSAPKLSNELEPPLPQAEINRLAREGLSAPQAIYCSQLVGQKPKNQDLVQFGVRRYAYNPDGNRVTI
ncbi:hypothetical protein IJT17_09665, partial [bacterium]|nr:hypothetical protein [bacterium]